MTLRGSARRFTHGLNRVVDALRGCTGPMTTAELAGATGLSLSYVQELVITLRSSGTITYGDPQRRENTGPPGFYQYVITPTVTEATLRALVDRGRPVLGAEVRHAAHPFSAEAVDRTLRRFSEYGWVRAIRHDSDCSYELTALGRELADRDVAS